MLLELVDATKAARTATGMPGIGTRAKAGRIQVVLVTKRKSGRTNIDPLSDFVPMADAIATLRQIAADRAFR